MHLLILGLSDIVRRRIRSALGQSPGVARVDVATRGLADGEVARGWTEGEVFRDYRAALDRSPADVVYVSLVNSEHERWAELAIASGRHTLVDKPACLGLRPAERLADLAQRRGVCLAEATVYAYHPQLDLVREQFRAAASPPTRVTATFSFPPMASANFRYRRALGGGALWDLGPYAASVGRIFFAAEPTTVSCAILARGGPDDVDTAFAMLTTFPDGRSVVGSFGFDTVYRNRIDVVGANVGVELDRVFTTPPDLASQLRVTRREGTSTLAAPPADAFAAFFDHVSRVLKARDWTTLTEDLVADARTVRRLRDAAGEE